MKTHYEAIIVGAGVAGATTAILLATSGWSVAIIEKREFPRRKVCGECIAATNLALLDTLGLGDAFAELAGPPLERVALYAGDTELSAELPRLDNSRHAFGRALGREHLDTMLLRRAEFLGVTVCQPWTARDLAFNADMYRCRVRTPTGQELVLCAPVMISAHGSWEPKPGASTRRRRSRPFDLFAFKANFLDTELEPGVLPVIAFAGGYGGMVIADHGKSTLACCIRRDHLRAHRATWPGVAAGEVVESVLKQSCRGVRRALSGARREDCWIAVGPIRPGLRAPWHEKRGFAVGNAAGEAHPILGEGISMAMQAASLLCERLNQCREKLLTQHDHRAAGHAYARDWNRQFATRVHLAAAFAHLAMRPAATDALLPVLRRWPKLLTVGAVLGGKVHSVLH